MHPTALRVDPDRFLRTIDEMGCIGLLPAEAGGGRDRRPFSPADRSARAYLRQAAEASGLQVRVDGAANVSVRLPCPDADAQTLLIGSHLDTVPHGGAYDGAAGVLAGLEVVRRLAETDVPLRHHIEVVDFTDEEGRFCDFLGSRAMSGQIDQGMIRSFLESVAAYPEDLAAMEEIVPGGLSQTSIRQARRDPASLAGYLELHVEQGPRLEHAQVPIGLVSAIFGRRSWQLTFHGRRDHAGTTPLDLRADALVAASQFVASAPEAVRESFPYAVVTCGNVAVLPGVYNVVPHQVTVWVEFRAASLAELDGVEALLSDRAASVTEGAGLSYRLHPVSRSRPTPMDPSLQDAIRHGAEACGYSLLELPSGAGHDAQMVASVTGTGMLFVPSQRGRSHSPDEYTAPADLVAGADVLLQTVLAFSGTQSPT